MIPEFVVQLQKRLDQLEKNLAEKKQQIDDEIQSARSAFDEEIKTVKARLEADSERSIEIEKGKMILAFISALDNIERAVNSGHSELSPGANFAAEQLRRILTQFGVEKLEVLNQKFNPENSEAISVDHNVKPEFDGLIVDEALAGYQLGDQVIRPARVVVGRK